MGISLAFFASLKQKIIRNFHKKEKSMTIHEARNLKAQQIRMCRKYIRTARSLGLTETSTSLRYWTRQLQEWRTTSVHFIMQELFRGVS